MELYLAYKIENERLYLDREESHHCIKVMRHHAGDVLQVTDGQGKLYNATLKTESAQHCELDVVEILENKYPEFPPIHLMIAPTKNIDRFEWLLEKLTEIGVSEITPVICQRSERRHLKPERLKKILVSAMKQSLRCWLPHLNEPVPFDAVMIHFDKTDTESSSQKFILHCQQHGLNLLKHACKPAEKTILMVGPEGDFTNEEIQQAESNGFEAAGLGEARLRTETAGLIAVHTVHLIND